MKMVLLLLGTGIIFLQSYAEPVTAKADTTAPRILIINAFDASEMKARKNKKELFAELTDSLKEYVYYYLSGKSEAKATIIPELLEDTSWNSFLTIINHHQADMALVITDLNVYFEQTGVEVTKNYDGTKSREASYDICCLVSYSICRPGITTEAFEEKNCKFFTKRNVASGLLAAGPDVVGKKKYTYDIVKKNAFRFLNRNDYLFE